MFLCNVTGPKGSKRAVGIKTVGAERIGLGQGQGTEFVGFVYGASKKIEPLDGLCDVIARRGDRRRVRRALRESGHASLVKYTIVGAKTDRTR